MGPTREKSRTTSPWLLPKRRVVDSRTFILPTINPVKSNITLTTRPKTRLSSSTSRASRSTTKSPLKPSLLTLPTVVATREDLSPRRCSTPLPTPRLMLTALLSSRLSKVISVVSPKRPCAPNSRDLTTRATKSARSEKKRKTRCVLTSSLRWKKLASPQMTLTTCSPRSSTFSAETITPSLRISARDSTMVSLPPQLTRSSTLSPITFSGILKSQSETTQRATGINTTMPDPYQAATCSRCAPPNATLEAKSSRTTHTITFPTTPSTEHAAHI